MELSKYERARVIGARALQLASGAPPLIEISGDAVNPVGVAFKEFEKGLIPLVVIR